MKPDTRIAMQDLIQQIRIHTPFDMPEARACTGICNGCSMKLLEFLDTEIISWEQRLEDGEIPNLGDIRKLVRTSLKIYRVLQKNDLVPPLQLKAEQPSKGLS